MTSKPSKDQVRIVWGAPAIGAAINLIPRQVYDKHQHLPGAQKIDGTLTLNLDVFEKSFSEPSKPGK